MGRMVSKSAWSLGLAVLSLLPLVLRDDLLYEG